MLRTVLYLLLLLEAVPGQHARLTAQEVADRKCRQFMDEAKPAVSKILPLIQTVRKHYRTSFPHNHYCMDQTIEEGAALQGEFPHHALLGYHIWSNEEYEFRCGGSLISDRFVLTAAHCRPPAIVRLAEVNLSEEEEEQDFGVANFVAHPHYKVSASYHDIALVQLTHKVHFHSNIRPACLWTSKQLNQSTVMATGFGATNFMGSQSDILIKARLDIQERSACKEKFKWARKFKRGIIDSQLCVGCQHGKRDTCQGDSGGPIQVLTNPKTCVYHVVGVTSAGTPCGIGDSLNIYTAVASYLDWIVKTVWLGEA